MTTLSITTLILVSGIALVAWYLVYLAIMRTGSLNPIDWFWGPRLYDVTLLDMDELLCEVNQFPGDEYMIDWCINMTETYRDKGPRFVRKRKFVAFSACWKAIDSGIPTTNTGCFRDTWSGMFDIKDPFDWRYDADEQLKTWVKETRKENGYVGQVTDFTNTDEGIQISGVVFDEQLRKMISEGTMNGVSIGYPYEITTSTSDNDLLKSKYTIEELAQQAVNRDKEQDD